MSQICYNDLDFTLIICPKVIQVAYEGHKQLPPLSGVILKKLLVSQLVK